MEGNKGGTEDRTWGWLGFPAQGSQLNGETGESQKWRYRSKGKDGG